ncbi:MAG TPA: TonB C-terminal domain-containing protein [Verrucomicrobiae bacterium]|nr:TonB C-terminal domain-containing protein [Verrucomicrobiae bacterium]
MITRKKKDSAKINAVFSLVFHTVLIAALFYFAAREGMLGKKLKTIAVTLAKKEKEPEKPKEKPPEPKVETPKQETPKTVPLPRATPPPQLAAAPPAAAPAVAPPPGALPAFNFSDGAKAVETSSNPIQIYKGYVEFSLRSKWNRPETPDDTNFVAEVELGIDPTGVITGTDWKKGSGNPKWDDSVRKIFAQTKSIGRAPPKGFPAKFTVRFDVQMEAEEVVQ